MERATRLSAGYDLVNLGENYTLNIGERKMFNVGTIRMAENQFGLIKPRSGLASKFGIDVLGGVIDADYKQDVYVILINHGMEPVHIEKFQRIAQIIFLEYALNPFYEKNIDLKERVSGFGSTS
jgi:dUTP pyrophosphatase